MTEPDPGELEVISAWFGAFARGRAGPAIAHPSPMTAGALEERLRQRLAGELTLEERAVLADLARAKYRTRDRRMLGSETSGRLGATGSVDLPIESGEARVLHRAVLLAVAESALRSAWDPSVHVEEAVRAVADLDDVLNLLGERLVDWGSKDNAELTVAEGRSAAPTAARLAREAAEPANAFSPQEPELQTGRRSLAVLYESARAVRDGLEAGVAAAVPTRAPNVSALLGPLLAARMLSAAGGLDRLARLPSSTIQVLGAERAFFEHLRGRAPPPRHGLLFLHPTIQGAPRRERGRLARALAGKVAIAARLDHAKAPLRPELKESLARRNRAIHAERPHAKGRTRRERSVPPLDRASEDG